MIKAVIFDLDGVLIDADKWHFNALNVALQHSDIDPISWQEHLTIYKGIPTRKKLNILTERKGLKTELYDKINKTKQETTVEIIEKFCNPDLEKIEMMKLLKRKYKIVICSNAVRDSVELMLSKSGLLPFVDFYLSNQDVKNPKPNPEIYLRAFKMMDFSPNECIIVEDSDVGKKAAVDSGGILCSVSNPDDVNYYRVLKTINESNHINIVIPSAGQGKRFSEVGMQHPKPLIDVCGKPMIQLVLENFGNIGKRIIVAQKKHVEKYAMNSLLKYLASESLLVEVDGLTEGAACTVLKTEELINTNNELIIANSDQFLSIDIMKFIENMRVENADGGILTFKDDNPKWSYAKCNSNGKVTEVAEKIVISNHATVGVYYYKHGCDFVKYTKQMIEKNIRVNNEFYVCPVFNEFIQDGKNILIYEIDKQNMHGLGTPEDLKAYIEYKRNSIDLAA